MKIDTKANTLINLSYKIKNFLVPKTYVFTVEDWINKKNEIKESIKKNFNNKKIIIRSSTSSEDTQQYSLAGAFDSILNIDSKNSKKNYSLN